MKKNKFLDSLEISLFLAVIIFIIILMVLGNDLLDKKTLIPLILGVSAGIFLFLDNLRSVFRIKKRYRLMSINFFIILSLSLAFFYFPIGGLLATFPIFSGIFIRSGVKWRKDKLGYAFLSLIGYFGLVEYIYHLVF